MITCTDTRPESQPSLWDGDPALAISHTLDVLVRYYEAAQDSAELACLHNQAACANGDCLACEAARVVDDFRSSLGRHRSAA